MKKIILYIIFVSTFHNTSALTLREAVQAAMRNHPEILQNRAQVSAAKQGISIAQSGYYPKFDMNSSYGSEWTQSPFTQDLAGANSTTLGRQEFNIAVVENIYSGGGIVNEVDRNYFIFRSQAFKTMSVINDILLNVTSAYLNVLLQEQLVHIAKLNLDEHVRLLKLIKERSTAGIARTAEFDQGESRYALAEANLISAQGNQREAAVRFKKVVGIWPEKLVTPTIPSNFFLPDTVEKAVQEGFRRHPRIKSACEDIKQARAQRKVAKSVFLPKLDAVFTASRNRNLDGIPGPNNDQIASIRLTYNPFNGGGDLGRLKQTAFQIQEALEARDKAMIELKEKIQLDYNAWYANGRKKAALSNYVISIDKTRNAYFEQYRIGQRTFLDLLNSQNEAYRSATDYLQVKKDEIEARYRILNSIGRLVPYFANLHETENNHISLFELPKDADNTTMVQTSSSAKSLGEQVIYPTGKTTILPLPKFANNNQEVLFSYISPIKSEIPSIRDYFRQAPNNPSYVIELNGFKNAKDATAIAAFLQRKGYTTKTSVERKAPREINHVLVGPYSSAPNALKILDRITHGLKVSGIVREVYPEDNLSDNLPNE